MDGDEYWIPLDNGCAKQNICCILFLCDLTDSGTDGRRLVDCVDNSKF